MAVCQTEQWANKWTPYVRLTVTTSSNTATEAVLSYTLEYVVPYSAAQTGAARAYTIKIGGSTVKEDSYQINGKGAGTYTIATGTKTIAKTTSSQTITFSVSFNFNLTWSGVYGGTKTASGSISVGAKTSYTISYNANGGSGAPGSQTKWHGTNITLSSTKPTRTGYSFQGWATSSSGGVAYASGAAYSGNANATLYAVWKANTYTVSYNANGGSGAPGSQTKTYGVTLTLSSTKPTRTNYTFKGWATSASSTTVAYAAGSSYTANSAITLYAVWELAYVKPRIDDFTADRSDSSGTLNSNGTYIKVGFKWATDNSVYSISIQYKKQTDNEWTIISVSASGTSGTVSQIIGNGNIDTETSYVVRIFVSDSSTEVAHYTYSPEKLIGTIKYPIDFKKGGTGVAIGKVAEKDAFEVGMDMYDKTGQLITCKPISQYTNETDGVRVICCFEMKIGGIYQVAISFNHNTAGSEFYRATIYAILSIPCGYNNSKVVVRPQINEIATYHGNSFNTTNRLSVHVEGGGSEIECWYFNNIVYIYVQCSSGVPTSNWIVNVRPLAE